MKTGNADILTAVNYLFLYLRTTTGEEIARLRGMDLSPRESQVLELLLGLREAPEPTKEQATDLLKMSGVMFDKTCSVLLRKTFEKIVPEGGIALLDDINSRGLRPLFLHEMKRRERALAGEHDRDPRAEFYRQLFDVLHRRFSSDYDEKLARRIARKYLALRPSVDFTIYSQACILGAAAWTIAARGMGEELSPGLRRRLEANDRRITPATDPRSRYRQLNSWIIYYGQFEFDPDRRLELLRQSVALCEEHPDVLNIGEKVATLCKIAEEHYFYKSDLATPYRMYRDLFANHGEILAGDYYHATKFFQLSLINADYAGAEGLLRKYFGYDLRLEIAGRSKMGAINWTKYHLMSGRLDEARRYLDLAFEQNQKKFYVQYEIECRLLQTAWCYLNGDLETVERMAPANIKYLRSKNYTLKSSRYYPWFFKLAVAFVDEAKLGTPLTAALEAKLEEFMEGAAAQYGMLLKRMRGGR